VISSAFAFKLIPNPLHHGVLGIARSLGRIGVAVHANHESSRAPIRASRFDAGGVIWKDWPESAAEGVERLLEWGHGQPELALLIPVDDAAAIAVADHADVLGERFVFPRQDAALARRLSDKLELARLCEAHGVPTPRTRAPRNRAELNEAAEAFAFPVVLKRISGFSPSDVGLRSVQVVSNPAELGHLWDGLDKDQASNVLVQEFIPRGPLDIWMFNGYFDDESRCLVQYTGFKVRQYPPGQGPTTLGECRNNGDVSDAAIRLLSGLGYRGIVDMGFCFDVRDGRYKLLDVNPRIGSTFRLFVADSETDVVRALHGDLGNRPVATDDPPDGRRWMVEPYDVLSTLSSGRSVARWPTSIRGVRELAWFAADDPRPAAAVARTMLSRATQKATAALNDRRRRGAHA
jgi:predicted ATP-grasp superfamily ATP-dependent carboligase